MPTLPPSAKILVTGASGFLASHVTRTLLAQGYSVVGTVRTHAKGDYLVNLHKSNNFSYVIVEKIEAPNAFDAIIKGQNFDGISHIASPFHMRAKTADDFIIPAVEGTKNVLSAALKFGPTIKRVVVTSASSALFEPHPYPYTYSEADWNDASIRAVKEGTAEGPTMYWASKTLGERAAWTFVEEHKSEIRFDLSVICPPWMFGPVIHQVTTPDTLNLSQLLLFKVMKEKQENLTPEKTGKNEHYLGDVRDIAVAHLRAFTTEDAGGKRFLCSDSPWCNQDVYDVLNEAGAQGIPKGFPGSNEREIFLHDSSRSVRVLGMKYVGLKEVILSAYYSFKEHFPGQL
ncbi:NAD(P)-binding protein [Clavulina sp. PMI_390]|nr:NAD(P)-binding protein [Clavulina sp. PMI_390]